MGKEAVFELIKNIMVSVFEFAPESIILKKNLHDDFQLDSLDMVDMVLALNDQLGKKIEPVMFKDAETVQDLVDIIHSI